MLEKHEDEKASFVHIESIKSQTAQKEMKHESGLC